MSFSTPLPRRAIRAVAFLLLLAAWLPRAAAAQAQYHVIEKGETLYSIARSYGVAAEVIAKANSIDDPSRLRAGMKLLIPGDANTGPGTASAAPSPAQKYKVVKGDTLFSIARSFGVGLDALRSANRMKAASVIKPGDTLYIPAGAKVTASAAVDSSAAGAASTAAAADPAPASGPAATAGSAPAVPEAVKTSAKAVTKGLTWPCAGEILYLDGKAYGIVIKSRLGEAEKAIASGTVSSAGPYRGYGNVVFVLSRGYIYVYGGNESISVRAGDRVSAGQELGKVGMDAKQGGPAAYFLVFKNGQAVDPAAAPRD